MLVIWSTEINNIYYDFSAISLFSWDTKSYNNGKTSGNNFYIIYLNVYNGIFPVFFIIYKIMSNAPLIISMESYCYNEKSIILIN